MYVVVILISTETKSLKHIKRKPILQQPIQTLRCRYGAVFSSIHCTASVAVSSNRSNRLFPELSSPKNPSLKVSCECCLRTSFCPTTTEPRQSVTDEHN